jgi:hypothetical protein
MTTQRATDPSLRINASPSKEFFIYMLTRDVQLTRAIIDLLDNCVDGAKRLRGASSFDGLWVRIEVSADRFKIVDNCGGIPVDVAREYAFRFGRPKTATDTPRSMGLFGVGMKRTFFKLGNVFEVKSRCETEEFDLKVNVDDWMMSPEEDPNDWHFQFTKVFTDLAPLESRQLGTDIEVTELHPSIESVFKLENFTNQLMSEISAAHMLSIQNGLGITVNAIPVQLQKPGLFVSDQIQPAILDLHYSRKQLDGEEGDGVRVHLIAGLSERSLPDGGWYIFCNGRLVLKADQSSASIWGPTHSMRQYHPDVAFFRGYAFFDSAVSSLLPWTTTKTGVDIDSGLYKTVQQQMIEISKPILAFLTSVTKGQKEGSIEDNALEDALKKAQATSIQNLTVPALFSALIRQGPPGPKISWIRYSKPLEDIDRAKALMGVKTPKEVGERSFDYYLEYEGAE